MKVSASLWCVLLLATACSTPPATPVVRFNEQDKASLIIRHYTDDISYVLKPAQKDGPFLSVLKRDAVLALAKQQADRQLAVVILIHYSAESEAARVKDDWTRRLTALGYERVVFLHSEGGSKVDGLPVLAQVR
jgi:hypothetical protein